MIFGWPVEDFYCVGLSHTTVLQEAGSMPGELYKPKVGQFMRFSAVMREDSHFRKSSVLAG